MEYKVESMRHNAQIRISSAPVYSYPPHIHTYCEMILYEPFDGEITVNEQQIKADAGCIILVAPLDLHRVCVSQGNGARFIKVELNADKTEQSVLVRDIAPNDFLWRVFEELLSCPSDYGYTKLLADTAIHIIQKKGESIPPITDSPANYLAMRAVKLVYENFCKPITLSVTAQVLFVSPQYLSKVFKNMVGVGFSHFLSELRLNRAVYLLTNTEKPITEICFECGYSNLSHFLRRFKQRFGVKPSDYRKATKAPEPTQAGQQYTEEYN